MTDGAIVLDLDLGVPVEELWEAWTVEPRVVGWLAARAKIELRPGGAYELGWSGDPEPHSGSSEARLSTVEEEYMLKFAWKGPVEFAELTNRSPLPTRVTVRFQPLGPGRSRLRLEHEGWKQEGRWPEARAFQERAWKEALARLKQVLEPP